MVNPWRVEAATTREQLQGVLNTLDADGYYITFVLTEGGGAGSVDRSFAFTVVAKQRRMSGQSEARSPVVETHVHTDRAVVDALEAAPGARREPLTMTLNAPPSPSSSSSSRKKKR
jgi:hypothetical protein